MPSEGFLQRMREQYREGARGPDPADGPTLEVREPLGAVLLHSRLLDRDVWLARDECTRAELQAEDPETPVLLFREVPLLRGKPPALLNSLLDAKVVFRDALLIH